MRARDWYFSLPRPQIRSDDVRDSPLLVGLLVMPVAHLSRRAIARSGVRQLAACSALYFDFFKGLFEPRPSCWVVVVGPFAFLTLVRLFCRLILRKI